MTGWTEAWRIFEAHEGCGPKTLFHGYHGSRELQLDTPLRAKQGIVTNPGKKIEGKTFRAGWHVALTLEDAEKYFTRFNNSRNLVVCKVFVKNYRPKPRSPHPVFLAKDMLVTTEDWQTASSS